MRMQGNWGRLGSHNLDQAGLNHAANVNAEIRMAGQTLLVTTPGKDGQPTISRSIRFLPQPLSASSAADLDLEGVMNMAEGQPTDFICAGNETVYVNDEIAFDGGVYLVLAAPQADWLQGVALMRHCVCKRAQGIS